MSGGGAHPPGPIGHEHPDVTGGWLRPAIFGAMDGLVSNVALISGVAGGSDTRQPVILAGLAGLAAGAFSMAAGEYTSVATQSEHVKAEIEVERRELAVNGPAEEAELADLYVARGMDPQLAADVAHSLHQDPELALEVHAREELGVDPGALPSPLVAAGSSFGAFIVGALIPLVPYFLGAASVLPSVVLSLVGLFVLGAVATRVTTRSWWYGGTRQLVLGALACAVTYGLGNLVAVGLG